MMEMHCHFNLSIYLKVPYDACNEDLCDLRDDIALAISRYDVELLGIHAGPYSYGEGSVSIASKRSKPSLFSRVLSFMFPRRKI